ncbi:MAG: TonB-dependent receptor [Gammaproteobacteria bacterium]
MRTLPSGALDLVRDTSVNGISFSKYLTPSSRSNDSDSTEKDTALRLGGSLWSWPGGKATLTALLEYRDLALGDYIQFTSLGDTLSPARSQTVKSIYMETVVPIFSEKNSIPGVELLELQIAGRRDEYKTTGATNSLNLPVVDPIVKETNKIHSTDPTLGLRYRPVRDVTFRGSFGTGFLPPRADQLVTDVPVQYPAIVAQILGLTDPRRGNEPLPGFTLTFGGNPGLLPEDSRSWSFGTILTPRFLPSFRMSVDWTKIKKTNNINFLTLTQSNINNELVVPGLITRAAPAPGDPYGVGQITGFDSRLRNVAVAEVEAYDMALSYVRNIGQWGNLTLRSGATRQMHHTTQSTLAAAPEEIAGLASDLRWKGNLGLTWDYRAFAFSWLTTYYDKYWLLSDHSIVPSQGSASIPRQVYHDMFVGYDFGARGAGDLMANVMDGLQVQLALTNIFNKEPPVDVYSNPQAFYSSFGDPRMARYSLTLKKRF